MLRGAEIDAGGLWRDVASLSFCQPCKDKLRCDVDLAVASLIMESSKITDLVEVAQSTASLPVMPLRQTS
jgi:hypothetical protein